jgi:tetratricopeptide (TPR) repeat protein
MKSKVFSAVFLVALLAPAFPVLAAPTASEASGKVVDAVGNPVIGAVVTFVPQGNPALKYTAKTNKKGRYYVAGLFTPQEGDRWDVTIEAEGYLPVEMTVESRTVNKVLVGDVRTVALKPESKIPEIMIMPMGLAKVDFTMSPEDEVMEQARQRAAAAAAAAAEEAGEPVVPQVDPWDEALGLASTGDLEGSVPFFEKAIKKEPDDVDRVKAYAKVLYQLDRYDEAKVQAQRAIEMAPDAVDARMVLYSVHVAEHDMVQAKATLEAALKVAPQDVRVLEQLAYVATESGNLDEAIAAFEAVTEADPENGDAWLSLGDLYAATGQMEKSEAAFQRVSELDPADAHQIFFNLGALIVNKPSRTAADTDKAILAFRKALEIKPDYAPAHRELALVLLGIGDRQGAADSLASYVKLAPDAPDAPNMQRLIETLRP